ncbi:hypothetical protein QYE76_001031 [Lolium multiflorum]|nr:hypothetical protein QYE76_001031 [Lolium multiflorum]
MVKSARLRRTQHDRAAGPVLPDDLVLWEILYRLPAKELLRCRAVCRSWRRLSCDAEFLLAHHKHQPSLPLVPATIDAFDILQSPAVRRPILGFSSHTECSNYYIHASCDGLLLLSRTYRLYYICNPATRQWCPLPNVTNVAALCTITARPASTASSTGTLIETTLVVLSTTFSPWVPPPWRNGGASDLQCPHPHRP